MTTGETRPLKAGKPHRGIPVSGSEAEFQRVGGVGNMSRWSVVVLAVFAGFLAGLVPAGVSLYLVWTDALSKERTYLRIVAVTTVERWEQLYKSSTTLLAELANYPEPHCSDAHIARLRKAKEQATHVREIGVFAEGRVSCQSSGSGELPELGIPFTQVRPGGGRRSCDMGRDGQQPPVRRGDERVIPELVSVDG